MLTNERLEEIRGSAIALKSMTESEQTQIIDELLALRSLRDAVDEEVDTDGLRECLEQRKTLYVIARDFAKSTETRNAAKDVVDLVDVCEKLHRIAIARGQKLREAREEIERLKRETETLKGYFHKSAFETADGYQVVINRKGNDQLANLQHEDGDGGYYDLLPGGLDQ